MAWQSDAQQRGIADKIATVAISMEEPPFEKGGLDAIWSEGAIYKMGLEKGEMDLKPIRHVPGIGGDTHVDRAKCWAQLWKIGKKVPAVF